MGTALLGARKPDSKAFALAAATAWCPAKLAPSVVNKMRQGQSTSTLVLPGPIGGVQPHDMKYRIQKAGYSGSGVLWALDEL